MWEKITFPFFNLDGCTIEVFLMDKEFDHTHYLASDYLFIRPLKLIHVSKKALTTGLYFSCISPWASYQLCKIAGCAWAENAGNVFSAADFKGRHYLACLAARASRTCRTACWYNWPAVAEKRSRHSLRMRIPHLYVSGKRSIDMHPCLSTPPAPFVANLI